MTRRQRRQAKCRQSSSSQPRLSTKLQPRLSTKLQPKAQWRGFIHTDRRCHRSTSALAQCTAQREISMRMGSDGSVRINSQTRRVQWRSMHGARPYRERQPIFSSRHKRGCDPRVYPAHANQGRRQTGTGGQGSDAVEKGRFRPCSERREDADHPRSPPALTS
jgi:hypothetical protein